MASLKDVAKLANVSSATVSRALNSPERVDAKTLKRIQEAMKKLNYKPNLMASSLRSRTSKQIALVVPDAAHNTSARIIQYASAQLQALGYTLIVGCHGNKFEVESELLSNYFRRNIDGIILYLIYDEALAIQSLLKAEDRRVPVVIVGRHVSVPSMLNVSVDNYKAGVIAGEYLLSLGHKSLATVTGPLLTQWARDRLDGFRAAISDGGANLSWFFSQDDRSDFDVGLAAAEKLLVDFPSGNFPTAIWAHNDIMAAGLIKYFGSVGVRVPEDISVLGMDDIELATMFSPAISTIKQPFDEIVNRSIQLITDEISAAQDNGPHYIGIEPSLVIRDSTAKLP